MRNKTKPILKFFNKLLQKRWWLFSLIFLLYFSLCVIVGSLLWFTKVKKEVGGTAFFMQDQTNNLIGIVKIDKEIANVKIGEPAILLLDKARGEKYTQLAGKIIEVGDDMVKIILNQPEKSLLKENNVNVKVVFRNQRAFNLLLDSLPKKKLSF